MSGRQLATALGVSPSWINYRLTGRQPIDLNDLHMIADALGVSVLQLFPEDVRSSTLRYLAEAAKPATPRPRRGPAKATPAPESRRPRRLTPPIIGLRTA